ncbi:hypothetical protein TVAG_426670 [Trichomonas vaginalis G3]|uniref:Uncharacterized protein n=1 Tax=Trichomonas vaginalis (strain ATCC PRA-98 / G3) TaxID=412133 RepID=A2DYT3_TRIV3|nr:hypothetical protein TVAGG3_0538420 [Trichomonas vaginalis G3]EAY14473.1 hypothetical protein TVAG_426670 [Trichomonas vaginalis G3]KAI5519653.1 hypothetical protein TVAGG3_0538420 [Trichomonas vaginalis G3]|eukprot:XP_001326696.1 hypothetical protein [Trichomonas vaginalis G3]
MLWEYILFCLCWKKYCLVSKIPNSECPAGYELIKYEGTQVTLVPDDLQQLSIYITSFTSKSNVSIGGALYVNIDQLTMQDIYLYSQTDINEIHAKYSIISVSSDITVGNITFEHSLFGYLQNIAKYQHVYIDYFNIEPNFMYKYSPYTQNLTIVISNAIQPYLTFGKNIVTFTFSFNQVGHEITTYIPKTLFYDILVVNPQNVSLLMTSKHVVDLNFPSKIKFAESQGDSIFRIDDSFYSLEEKYKCQLESDNPNNTIIVSTPMTALPSLFIPITNVTVFSQPNGSYCLSSDTEMDYLCPYDAQIYKYHTADPIKDKIYPVDNYINFYLTTASDFAKPFISITLLEKKVVVFTSLLDSPFPATLGLVQEDFHPIVSSLELVDVSITIISVNPILVNTLILTNSVIETKGAMIAATYSVILDEDSGNSITMLTPILNYPTCVERIIRLYAQIDKLLCAGSYVLVNNNLNFSKQYMKVVRFYSYSTNLRIDYQPIGNRENLQLPFSLDTFNDGAKITFGYSWDSFVPAFFQPYNFPISGLGELHFYSEIPTWPSIVFDVGKYTVFCSTGGEYCLYAPGSTCPSLTTLAIPIREVDQDFKIYASTKTGTLHLRIASSHDQPPPVILMHNLVNLNNFLVIDGKTNVILDASIYSGYIHDITLSCDCSFIANHPRTLNVYKLVLLQDSSASFYNVSLKVTQFFITKPTIDDFNFLVDRENTNVVLSLDKRFISLILREKSLYFVTEKGKNLEISTSFQSIQAKFEDEGWREPFTVKSETNFVDLQLIMISLLSSEFKVHLDDSLYNTSFTYRIIIPKPQNGKLLIKSSRDYSPDLMLLPVPADNVQFDLPPHATPVPTTKVQPNISMKITGAVYSVIVLLLLLALFLIAYFSISCQKSPELPEDLLMINSVQNSEQEISSKF